MITTDEALKAIKTIARYCDLQKDCKSCAIGRYCDVMEDKEVPIPWLIEIAEYEK